MIVDDSDADVLLVKAAISGGGFSCRIHRAKDGIEAMNYLRNHVTLPDLILLDINMPRMNGIEMLKVMKADHRLVRIPVVVMSTSEAERDIIASYSSGAAGFLAKPLDLEHLFKAVQDIENYWFGVVHLPPH
ncbi:MAG: response regulator [Phaeospirillum sp.]|nr:response regulator [Phaeospirillum sp.]